MRRDYAHSAEPCYRPHASADYRDFIHQRHDNVPRGVSRHVCSAHSLKHLDTAAAARAVHESYDRKPELARELFCVACLVADCGVSSATSHSKIISSHDHAPPINTPCPHHVIRRHK